MNCSGSLETGKISKHIKIAMGITATLARVSSEQPIASDVKFVWFQGPYLLNFAFFNFTRSIDLVFNHEN